MTHTERAILNALTYNMGYRRGETVAVVLQEWREGFPEHLRVPFEKSRIMCQALVDTFRADGVAAELKSYAPAELRNGADATRELYEKVGTPDILFIPTVFSLTHTAFRRSHSERGARVASMPTFTLDMFEEGGPMSIDYPELVRRTAEVGAKLRENRFARVTAANTDITIEIDRENVHISDGMLTKPGSWGNLPGAEAYAPPVHEGTSSGFFTVPAGWGGVEPLRHAVTFYVENGRITALKGGSSAVDAYIDETIRPILFEKPDYNILAELGIGTNWLINADYIARKGWSALTAEKIGGSAHFANGNSKAMGGKNDVPVHIDWVVPDVTIAFRQER